MDQRNYFQYYIDEVDGSSYEDSVETFYIEKEDTFFLGKEVIIDDTQLNYYIYPLSENRAMLMLYLGDTIFDGLVNNLDDSNISAVTNAWPILMNLLKRGVDDNYSDIALIKFNSEEISFWSTCCLIENVDLTDLEVDYVLEKLKNLIQITTAMISEINDNEISGWDSFFGGCKSGFKQYFKAKKVMGVASVLAGVLGIPFFGDN